MTVLHLPPFGFVERFLALGCGRLGNFRVFFFVLGHRENSKFKIREMNPHEFSFRLFTEDGGGAILQESREPR